MNRIETLTIASLAFGVVCLFSPAEAQFVGKYAGEFMAGGGGGRSLAMGRAGAAVSGDPFGLLGYNPAVLATIQHSHLGLLHSERFEGVVDYDMAVFARPEADGRVLGIGLIRLGVNGIPFTRLENPGAPPGDQNRIEVDKYVTDGEYALYVSKAGRKSFSSGMISGVEFDYGIAPKLIFKHIGDYRAYGIGLDVGVVKNWEGKRPIAIGFAVQDLLGTVLAWEQTGRKELIPSTFRLGGSLGLPLPLLEADLALMADLVYRTESLGESDAAEVHGGLEYKVRNTVALRAGSDNGEPTFGGGISFKPLAIDYAFINHDDLGETHRISLTANWGGVK